MKSLQFVFLLWLVWGCVSLVALLFIIARPKLWEAWIEKENNYWVARGRFSARFAETIKKLEKGIFMKLLLGANVLLSLLVICLILRLAAHRQFRAAFPPPAAPIQHRPPGH